MAAELIHVILQYCNARLPGRAAEFDESVRRNLDNPWVKRVHNLCEPQTDVPEEFRHHPKFIHTNWPRWLTYRDAFEYANANLVGEIVCLCNLDIFLDAQTSDWQRVSELLANKVVLCLSRWDWVGDGTATRDPGFEAMAMANTQDGWFFRPPIDVPDCDFEIGTIGCDNAIAERFRRAGFFPFNAPQAFRIFHLDNVRGKAFTNQHVVHQGEAPMRPVNRHPERRGQWLVPDFDQLKSLDGLAAALKLNELQNYAAICELLNKHHRIENPD